MGVSSRWLQAFLHLQSLVPVVVMAVALGCQAFLAIARGILQGVRSFSVLGSTLILEAVIRLVVVYIFVSRGWGVTSAFLAFIIATLPPYGVIMYCLRETFAPPSGGTVILEGLRGSSFQMLAVQVALAILMNSDIPVARYFFSGAEAGHYAAMAFLGRAVIFSGVPLVWIMFSSVSYQYFREQVYYRILWASVVTILCLASVPLMFSALAPDTLLSLLFGHHYESLGGLMAVYVFNGTVFLLVNLLSMFRIGVSKNDVLIPLGVATGLLWLGLSLFHRNPHEVVFSLSIALAIVLVHLVLQNWKFFRPTT
jgi:O-antigen/teichoic acid export membrane protein